jgi:hypothetical protein
VTTNLHQTKARGKNGTYTGHQQSKKLFNRATQELKQFLHDHKNYNIQTFLNGLTPTASTEYSLWKTTKRLKAVTQTFTPLRTPQGTWARTSRPNNPHSEARETPTPTILLPAH